jgi:hypothetical protein
MSKLLLTAASLFICGTTLFAQRKCGLPEMQNVLSAQYPGFAEKIAERTAHLQAEADNYAAQQGTWSNGKTTATTLSPIPVVFHVIVSTAQLAQIGGNAGVLARVDSQIAVLNRDYNRQNSDSTLIPSGWKSLYKSTGVKFACAHRDPLGHGTQGFEIKTTTLSFTAGSTGDYNNAKFTATGGFDAWDVNKYLNVWCIFFSDNSGLLGITTPYSFTVSGGGPISDSHRGICLSYDAFGKRVSSTDFYAGGGIYDRGRTLTHEIGHFFELRHTWGDDGGACPWSSGADDGLSDTPPESDHTYGNPVYTISGGTEYDGCKMNGTTLMQPIGIPCLDFMDYTDDNAMHMFTTMQVNLMASNVISTTGESYPLTQNPTLLAWPTEVSQVEVNNGFNIYPNPTDGTLNISFNGQTDVLSRVTIVNSIGQQVQKIDCDNVKNGIFSTDLSGMGKGIYFVTCNFASGSITRKILLQ